MNFEKFNLIPEYASFQEITKFIKILKTSEKFSFRYLNK